MKIKNFKVTAETSIITTYVLVLLVSISAYYLLFKFIYSNVYLVITAPDKIQVDSAKIQIPDLNTSELDKILKNLNEKTSQRKPDEIKNIF